MPETLLNSTDVNERESDTAKAAVQDTLARENDEPEFIALKYTFTPSRGDMGGAFCLIFEGATGEIVFQSLWLTRPYVQKAFKTTRDWRTFIKLLSQLGPYEKLWGEKLTVLLPDLVSTEDLRELFEEGDAPVKRHLLRIEGHIRRGFERATQCFFDVASEVEFLTRNELVKAKILESPGNEEDASDENDEGEDGEGKEKSFKGTVIQCLACVDPVWGKPSSEVVPGDILEVKIEGDSGPSALVQKFLEETGQTPTFPVDQVNHREDKTYIYLHISDEIQGIMTLTKDLRLKTKQSYVAKKRRKTAMEDLFFFALLGFALVGLLLAVRYFFF